MVLISTFRDREPVDKSIKLVRDKPYAPRRQVISQVINPIHEIDKTQYYANFHFFNTTWIVKYWWEAIPLNDSYVVYKWRPSMFWNDNTIHIPVTWIYSIRWTMVLNWKQVKKIELRIMDWDYNTKCVLPYYWVNTITTPFYFDMILDKWSRLKIILEGEWASWCKVMWLDEKHNSFIWLQLVECV